MIYLVAIGLILIVLIFIWIRRSRGSGNYNHRSNVWQHHQDQNYIDDYARKSKKKHLHLLTMTSFGIRMTNKIEGIYRLQQFNGPLCINRSLNS